VTGGRGTLLITIGKPGPADQGEWQELFAGYNEFYRRTMSQEFFDQAWVDFTADDRVHALGAKSGGRLLGIAHFLTHASTTSADWCYLQDLFTAPEARGKGIARGLIGAVSEWAQARGCDRLYWATHNSNAQARLLYDQVAENRGFILYTKPLR
jgi:GNAT superfamily N-acetyltransferase